MKAIKISPDRKNQALFLIRIKCITSAAAVAVLKKAMIRRPSFWQEGKEWQER